MRYKANQDLMIGFVRAHNAGAEFESSPELLDKYGWKDGVEEMKKDDGATGPTGPATTTTTVAPPQPVTTTAKENGNGK